MLEEETAGDPMSEQKWQRSSLRHLMDELSRLGYWISDTTIGRLPKQMDYSLKANAKRLSISNHPDRDQQFRYIASQKQAYLNLGLPTISVDVKKKSLSAISRTLGKSGAWKLQQ